MQQLIFTHQPSEALCELTRGRDLWVIADENTAALALPRLRLPEHKTIVIPAGDTNKDLDTLSAIWRRLSEGGATRSSLAICLGGGVVTDIGGFASATFKRGMPFVNVPTTLLGAVDAAVGGKTGINFCGLKNEIGAFCPAQTVVISTLFFSTLPLRELLSGYAEMLKHGLLEGSAELARLLECDIENGEELLPAIERSVAVKQRIVESDPREQGPRKALNLGHTCGHAIESLALRRGHPVPHGYAVAWGLVCELALSAMRAGFPKDTLYAVARFVKERYGRPPYDCADYADLLSAMAHDKKNPSPDRITFTLLSAPGVPLINQTATPTDIEASLDITLTLLE